MNITVTGDYLWLPIQRNGSAVKLHFLSDGVKFQEIDIPLHPDHPDYYAAMDLRHYARCSVEIRGNVPDDMLESLHFHDTKPDNTNYPFRPRIHFAAPFGWINDPNGLVFADGIWHLYHQWNPYGTEWGNMHWGHAVSHDLFTWEHKGIVMEPDEFGTVYSGCGWQDCANAAGFGRDTLLFFYTASGGCNQWSVDAGNQHTQRLAVSTDQGETLRKSGLILDHIKGGNRDPKVFYHPESKAYVMVLFLDDYEFAVFRSQDLIHWEESQRFSAPEMRECPDLFELQVVNEPGRKKWVFWSADGYYLIGQFDGYHFLPETEVLTAYDTALPYAAQTYAGVKDRVISVAWLRTGNDRGNFRGMMSVPSELSLVKQEDGYRIRFLPVREIRTYFSLNNVYTPEPFGVTIQPAGKPVALKTSWLPGKTKEITAGGKTIRVRAKSNEVLFIADHGIIEYWADDGLIYGAVEVDEDVLFHRISLNSGISKVEMLTYQNTL